jgi:hypothetical protein
MSSKTPDAWGRLTAALDAWAETGRTATLWWRDDDAADATPALEAMLARADQHGVPLAVAVIPGRMTPALPARLAPAAGVTVLQHGYAHINHAPPEEKKCELGGHRPADHVVAELALGWQSLADALGAKALPVMVPPWNRIAPNLVPYLGELRFSGLSTFGARGRAQPVRGVRQVNVHTDLIDWPGTRRFAGDAAVLDGLSGHLAARLENTADPDEPTGLMTHHLAHDEASWRFLDQLFMIIGAHPAARWLDAAEIFAPVKDTAA